MCNVIPGHNLDILGIELEYPSSFQGFGIFNANKHSFIMRYAIDPREKVPVWVYQCRKTLRPDFLIKKGVMQKRSVERKRGYALLQG